MAIIDVIKNEGDSQLIVWKHPKENFNTSSQLIVHESQEAIFTMNGAVLETYGPGRHTLESENFPVVKTIVKFVTGGKNAFQAQLYFVNLTQQMAIRWGTDSKISYLDPVYDFPLEIGACGEMMISVKNSTKLLVKMIGMDKQLTQDQLTRNLRAFVMTRVKSTLAQVIMEKKISIFEVDMHLQELSDKINEYLEEDFFDYGINVDKFLITVIAKPDEDKNYLRFKDLYFRRQGDVMEAELQQRITLIEQQTRAQQTVMEAEAMAKKRELEGYTYQQEMGFGVAKEVAQNEAVGQISNIGVGLGMITGVAGEIGRTVSGVASEAIGSATTSAMPKKKFCTNCGHAISGNAKFCENCGNVVQRNDVCSGCGFTFTNDAKFCPECGTKRGI